MTHTQPPYHLPHGNPPHNRPRRVVLVGASIRAAAESAQRAGFLVTGVDLFGDTDTRAACDQFFQIPPQQSLPSLGLTKPERLAPAAGLAPSVVGSVMPMANADGPRGNECSSGLPLPSSDNHTLGAILKACSGAPVAFVGGLNGHQALIDQLSRVCDPVGPSQSVQSRLRDPARLVLIANAAGVRVPTTYDRNHGMKLPERSDRNRWLLKQPNSCGGLGVRWLTRTDWDPSGDFPGGGIISQWVPGRSFGISFLSDGASAKMIGACRSLFTRKGDCPFVYAGSLGPIGFGGTITEQLRRLGQAVVDSFQLQGLFNADVVIDSSNQIWLLEINPRWSGSTELIERSLGDGSNDDPGISLLGTVLDATPLSRLPIKPNAIGPVYWKRILYARETKRFCLDDVRGDLGKNQSIHDIPGDGTLIRRGEPVLTLITAVDSRDRSVFRSYRTFRKRIECSL